MSLLQIKIYPKHKACLERKCDPIEIDSVARNLAEAMLETMYHAPGIGLAAPQIGRSLRLFVMDCASKDEEPAPLVFFNPEIIEVSKETHTQEEGCLSLPRFFEMITRPAWVAMRYWDMRGNKCERKFKGLWATCAQHELDHLNGTLFIDHLNLSRTKRNILINKIKKQHRSFKYNEIVEQDLSRVA